MPECRKRDGRAAHRLRLGARKLVTDFRTGKKLGPSDHLITYEKPPKKPDWMSDDQYLAAPDTLIVREVKVGGKILVTTLLSPRDASKRALKDLYKSRWNVELDLRNIKTTLGMETLAYSDEPEHPFRRKPNTFPTSSIAR